MNDVNRKGANSDKCLTLSSVLSNLFLLMYMNDYSSIFTKYFMCIDPCVRSLQQGNRHIYKYIE